MSFWTIAERRREYVILKHEVKTTAICMKYVCIGTLYSVDPGTDTRGPEDPGTEDPGTEDPGTKDPGTEDPGTGDPGI